MIIKSTIKEPNYRSIIALTHEHVYNAWKRGNTLHFYILSNDKVNDTIYHFPDVVNYFTVHIENGEIQLTVDDVTLTLYSHDELMHVIKYGFYEYRHDIMTLVETLLYTE